MSKRWKDKTFADLKVIVQDSTKLQKLTHDELNIIIGSTVFLHNQTVKKSWRLQEKCNAISKLIGDGVQIQKERFVRSMTSLAECAARTLRSSSKCNSKVIPKYLLNIIYATVLYPDSKREWLQVSPFSPDTELKDARKNRLVFISRVFI